MNLCDTNYSLYDSLNTPQKYIQLRQLYISTQKKFITVNSKFETILNCMLMIFGTFRPRS